ncbi:MAG: LapA family protein [Limisphaerales bacterium]
MADGVKANLKMTGISLLAILMLVIILQNTEDVVTQILWVEISMPRALLLLLTFAVGFGLGYLFFYRRHRKTKDSEESA